MQHTQKHFQRAVLEGICFELKSIVESVENTFGTQKRITVSGGIIRSQRWVQMLSDIINKPLFVADDHDASAMGAARWAFEVMGEEMKLSSKAEVRIDPNPEYQKVYANGYALFKKLNQQMESVFNEPN
jgi:gluconokinase